jgi:hypothetical protein
MSSNVDLTKFISSSENLLEDLYNEERSDTNSSALGGLDDYLALPKTEAYIKREEAMKQAEEEKQAYEDRIEEKYDHIINNKISNQ